MSVNIDYTGSNGPAFLEGIEAPRIDETTMGGGTYMAQDALIYGASGPRVKHVTGAVHIRNNADDDFADLRANSLILDGDLTVNGTQTIIDTTTLSVEDPTIEVARNQADPPTLDAGLIVQRGGVVPNAQLLWDESEGYWTHGIVGTMKRMGDLVDPTTTQGDLIVRGASAIQRLGIGTAGQVLTVNGTATGYVFSTPTGTVPNGTLAYQHLEWNGAAWVAVADHKLPTGSYSYGQEGAADSSASVLGIAGAASTGAGNQGGTVTITGGANTNVAGGQGGVLNLLGGPGVFGGAHGGEAQLKGGSSTTGNGAAVALSGGDAGTTGDGGDVFIYGGHSASGTKGTVRFYNPLDVEYVNVSFDSSSTAPGGGTRIVTGLVFTDSCDGSTMITCEDSPAGSGGTDIRLFAGEAGSEADGGDLELQATWGGASTGTFPGGGGGSITIWAGSGGAGSGAQAPGDGGWVYLIAGYGGSGGTGNSDGGHIEIRPATGQGTGAHGAARLGLSTMANPTLLFVSTDHTNPTTVNGPGLRYNSATNAVEVCSDGAGTWAAISSGTVLPSPIAYGHLEGNAGGSAWTTVSDITLPGDADRTITMPTASASSGNDLTVEAQTGGDGGQYNGGDIALNAGAAGAPAPTGKAGNGGRATVHGGNGGTVSGTNTNKGGGGGDLSLLAATGGNDTTSGGAGGGAGGWAELRGGDGGFSNNGTGGQGGGITVQAGQGGSGVTGGQGGELVLRGGTGLGAALGGDVIVRGGVGDSGNGGHVYLRGGLSLSGTNGDVIIGDQWTTRVEVGGTSSVEYQLQANTSNRLITGADGNTIVMDGDTSHWILVAAPTSAGNGDVLRIGAGAGNGAANNGGDLYLEAGEGGTSGIDGTVHLAATYGYNIHAGAPIQQYLGSSTTYVHHVAIYLGSTTAANTWTEIYQTGTRRFEMVDNQVVVADIIVSARVNNVVAAYKYKAVITRDNGVASVVVENTIKETLFNNIGANTDFRVTADTTNGTFKVEVKSNTATQTNWTVGVRATSTVGIVA